MSYILDALKKSERERTLVRGVGFGDAGRRYVSDRRWMWWVVGATAAIAVVVAVWLIRHNSAPLPAANIEAPAEPTPVGETKPQIVPVSATSEEKKTPLPLVEAKVDAPAPVVALAPALGEASPLSAMSPEFRRSLPELTVNIHVYSVQESQRILYINNRQYKRGDQIPGGVVIEDILPDGVVMQFHGQRFKVPRPS